MGEADRDETSDGDQGADQHRKGEVFVGIGGRAHLVVTRGQTPTHGVDGGHRIVDHEGQGDDERAQRDSLQVDIRDIHDRKDHGQREWDRHRHHGTGPYAQGNETDDQHDANRLPERDRKLVDRQVDRQGLIRHQPGFDARGQVRCDVLDRLCNVSPERQGIATVAHGDRQPDRRFAIDPKHRLGRIGESPPDLGDIAEPQHAIPDRESDGGDVLLGGEGARDAQRDGFLIGTQHPGGQDDILRPQGRDQGAGIEAEPRQSLDREVDVDHLVLGAKNINLGDIGDQQEARTDVLDRIAQLPVGETIGGEGIDDPEGVTELIVEKGADDPLRQGVAHVGDLLTHLIPGVRNLPALRTPLEVHEDGGFAGAREAAQIIQGLDLLESPFESFGDLLDRVIHVRARPDCPDDHGAKGEGRIFGAAELVEGTDPGDQHRDHDENSDRAVANSPLGKVEAAHGDVPSNRTCWPGRKV